MDSQLSVLLVFLAGLLSFFSPCVLPIIPIFLGYLAGTSEGGAAGSSGADASSSAASAGAAATVDAEKAADKRRWKRTMLHAFFFVIGISAAFFTLGAAFTALGQLLSAHKSTLNYVAALILFILGLWMLFGERLQRTQRQFSLPLPKFKNGMSPLVALVMGFCFSFSWTPCVGPLLSAALLMASSADSSMLGFFYIGVYTLGFIIPFLAVSAGIGKLLQWLQKRRGAIQKLHKGAGVLLIIMAILLATGSFANFAARLASLGSGLELGSNNPAATAPAASPADGAQGDKGSSAGDENNNGAGESKNANSGDSSGNTAAGNKVAENVEEPLAVDFTLTDQYGKSHTLSDYKGKVVFLNFWASWCGPCRSEMPDIQKLYEMYKDDEDVVILSVAAPDGGDVPKPQLEQFLKDNGYTYPSLFDVGGPIFNAYSVRSLPTTYFIKKDGHIAGYMLGAQKLQSFKRVIEDLKQQ